MSLGPFPRWTTVRALEPRKSEIAERRHKCVLLMTIVVVLLATPVTRADGARDDSLPDAPTPAWAAANGSVSTGGPALRPTALHVRWTQKAGFPSTDPNPFVFALDRADVAPVQPSPIGLRKPFVTLAECPHDKTKAKECRVHWRQLLISSAVFITWQNTANAYSSYWYRYETTTGQWWDRYIASVTGYKFSVWSDGNPYLDDYIGHPFMGAITDALWIQNDPKGMPLEFSNTWPYWRSRLRALAFTAVYSTEWKLGPIGESGVGHQGDHLSDEDGRVRDETGFVSLVTTPVGGLLWTITEDVLDKQVIRRLEEKSRNPFLLFSYQFLNPARGAGNILRFRPPWYRDSRTVKADSFWSDPQSDNRVLESDRVRQAVKGSDDGEAPEWPVPGGKHELGAWWGLSLVSGHLFGSAGDVKYMPIDVRYSYRLLLHRNWSMRYSPEVTALAMLSEPNPEGTDPQTMRKRTYGSGLSPEGFQVDFFPHGRVQPFLSNNGGFIYFADRVLSPEGSRFMYTIDFGTGVNIFRKERQAVTIGYRYQHLSNANISTHNPGMDMNTFYVGVSRFRTKGS